MFDIGWTELMVIGVVALIVVGPKDLPMMFRTLGRFTGKVRRTAREFQRAMEDAADESGVRETASNLRDMTSPRKMGLDTLDEAAQRFEDWDPNKPRKTGKKAPGAKARTQAETPTDTGAPSDGDAAAAERDVAGSAAETAARVDGANDPPSDKG